MSGVCAGARDRRSRLAGAGSVTAAWRESGTTWKGAPTFESKAVATARFQPNVAPTRVEVTAAVKAAAAKPDAFHGWLLKSVTEVPLPGT